MGALRLDHRACVSSVLTPQGLKAFYTVYLQVCEDLKSYFARQYPWRDIALAPQAKDLAQLPLNPPSLAGY